MITECKTVHCYQPARDHGYCKGCSRDIDLNALFGRLDEEVARLQVSCVPGSHAFGIIRDILKELRP